MEKSEKERSGIMRRRERQSEEFRMFVVADSKGGWRRGVKLNRVNINSTVGRHINANR